MTFEPIKNVLQKVLANKKMAARFSAAEICVVAEKIWLAEMPNLSGKFAVKTFQNKILNVAVASSSIAAALRLAENSVRDALEKSGTKIKSVRYSTGLPEKILPF